MGSTHQTGPRVSDQKTGEVAWNGAGAAELADGSFAGDVTGTTSFHTTMRTYRATYQDLSSELATMAALMAERRYGTTAIRRSWPRRLDLGLSQAPTDHGEASAQAIKANGGRRCPSHGDGAWWWTLRRVHAWCCGLTKRS